MGSVAQIKGNDAASGGTSIATTTLASNVTSGNFLQLVVSGDVPATITPTKNSGTATIGTWTQRETQTEAGTGSFSTWLTCAITGTGTIDVLGTYGSSQTNVRAISIAEIAGVSGFQGSSSQQDGGNNPTTTVTVNVTTAPAFGVMQGVDDQGGTLTVGAGWTSDGSTGAAGLKCTVQHKAISITGNTTGNYVNAGFDRGQAAMLVWTDGVPPLPQGIGLRSQTFLSMGLR